MIDERENIFDETEYGTLKARSYNISNNDIDAFYDDAENLVFVLDKTINQNKPNVLLVINPVGDKKWDEILSGQYGVDLENVRPKQDNKYQKLDIEYSGLGVYKNLIDAFVSGDALNEHLVQLDILRDSAMRHSAMVRLSAANEIISKTNITIVKTRESIVRLKERLKTLRSRLSEQKKSIGRVSTKQSAAKILKLESMIEATNEKIKRAEKRLESAQKRLEIASVDAELATNLLNQPSREIKVEKPRAVEKPLETQVKKSEIKNEPLVVVPKYEVQKIEPDPEPDSEPDLELESEESDTDDVPMLLQEPVLEEPKETFDIGGEKMNDDKDVSENSEVKPLLDKDPEIINEDIAFKPISFDTPELVMPTENIPVREAPKADVSPDVQEKQEIADEEDDDYDVPEIEDKDEKTIQIQEIPEIPDVPEDLSENESDDVGEFDADFNLEQKPVLESMTSVPDKQDVVPDEDFAHEEETITEDEDFNAPVMNQEPVAEKHDFENTVAYKEPERPVNNMSHENNNVMTNNEMPRQENLVRPLPPVGVSENNKPVKPVVSYETEAPKSKPSFVYYFLLLLLIGLSVLTLWLYQKNIGSGKLPFFGSDVVEQKIPEQQPTDFFDDLTDTTPVVEEKPVNKPVVDVKPAPVAPKPEVKPAVINSVSDRASSFSGFQTDDEESKQEKNVKKEVVVNKPVYGAGSKYEEMFVYEEDQQEQPAEYITEEYVEIVPNNDYYEEIEEEENIVYEYVEEVPGQESDTVVEEENVVETKPVAEVKPDVKPAEPQRVVYNGDDIYDDGNYYEEGFDPEEAEYQAGNTGYDR